MTSVQTATVTDVMTDLMTVTQTQTYVQPTTVVSTWVSTETIDNVWPKIIGYMELLADDWTRPKPSCTPSRRPRFGIRH